MKKIFLAIAILAAFFIPVTSSAFLQAGGFVPYETAPSNYAPSAIRYDDFGSSSSVQFFNFQFSDQQFFSLNTGTRFEVNSNDAEPGAVVVGDVQGNSNGTKVVVKDAESRITLNGENVQLPLLPNCALLATDANGKIICSALQVATPQIMTKATSSSSRKRRD